LTPSPVSTSDIVVEVSEAERFDFADRALVEADLLIEDVSIDGMCGVY
jgi:mycofactocin precursor